MRELEEYKAAEEIRNMKTGRALGELKAQNDYEKVQIERKIEMVLKEKEELLEQLEGREQTIERMRADIYDLESRVSQTGS